MLTQDLRATAGAMSALYTAYPWLNRAQPPSFNQVIAMSLDEWEIELQACADEWKERATRLALGQPITEPPPYAGDEKDEVE